MILFLNRNYQQIIDWCGAILVLFIPLSVAIPNLLLIPFIITVLLSIRKYQIIKSPFLGAFSLFILFLLIKSLMVNKFITDLNINSRYLLLVILIALITQIKNYKRIELFFVLGSFIAILRSLYEIVITQSNSSKVILDNGADVNSLLGIERPYFGFILTLCVFICLKNLNNRNVIIKTLCFFGIIFFTVFNIYMSARLAIILCIVLIFVYLIKSNKIKRSIKIQFSLIITCLILVAIYFNKGISSRMHLTDNVKLTLHLFKEYEPRFVTWPCAINISKKDLVFLKGLKSYEDVENRLVKCYFDSTKAISDKQAYYMKEKFNTHNQFLDFLLISGIVPSTLLFAMFIYVLLSIKYNFESKVTICLFLAFFLVENVLHRQLGIYLFGVFASLYTTRIKQEHIGNH